MGSWADERDFQSRVKTSIDLRRNCARQKRMIKNNS
jgi:hypothetical protein